MFLVVCDAFNFCFWPDDGDSDFGVTVDGAKYYRSWGMGTFFFQIYISLKSKLIAKVACVKRAVDEGVPILNPKWQQNATLKELESVFRSDPGDSGIPLLNERHVGLNELGMSRESDEVHSLSPQIRAHELKKLNGSVYNFNIIKQITTHAPVVATSYYN